MEYALKMQYIAFLELLSQNSEAKCRFVFAVYFTIFGCRSDLLPSASQSHTDWLLYREDERNVVVNVLTAYTITDS